MIVSVTAKYLIQSTDSIEELTRAFGSVPFSIESFRDLTLRDQYFDTRDWAIAKKGWTFRWSSAADEHSLCLDPLGLPSSTQLQSLRQPVQEFPAHCTCIPAGAIRTALSQLNCDQLRQVLENAGRRRVLDIRLETDQQLRLVVDQTVIDAASSPSRTQGERLSFTELHFGNFAGQSQALADFVDHLQSRFSLIPSRLTNFERGLQCIDRPAPWHVSSTCRSGQPSKSRSSKLDSTLGRHELNRMDPVWKLLQRYLLNNLEALLRAEPWAWEGLHPEGVHRMRVATRRSRAALQAVKRALTGGSLDELKQELTWLAARLGAVRDLDVQRDSLANYTCHIAPHERHLLADYERHLAEVGQVARDELLVCLSSERYVKLARDLPHHLKSEFAKGLKPRARKLSIAEAAHLLIDDQYNCVLRQGRAIDQDAPSEYLHKLRIECKRLRYLFEIFRATYSQPLAKCIKQLKRLQELLGQLQDACVALQHSRLYAEQVPMQENHRGQLLACGHLMQCQHEVAERSRQSFAAEWSRFDRHDRLKKLLKALR